MDSLLLSLVKNSLTHVPFMIWVVIFVGVIIFGVLMRYLTNWKVDAFLAAVFVLGNSILVWRAHWIDLGYSEALDKVKIAQTEVAAFKKTNALIEACYARNTTATVLWDRTNGDCVRADGAVK